MRLSVTLVQLLGASPAFAQAPPPPPPRLEASAQFTFLDTSGNSSSQSLGAGGDVVWRPAPWTYTAKALFAQAEDDEGHDDDPQDEEDRGHAIAAEQGHQSGLPGDSRMPWR